MLFKEHFLVTASARTVCAQLVDQTTLTSYRIDDMDRQLARRYLHVKLVCRMKQRSPSYIDRCTLHLN